jgi:hypothetical protein
VCPDMEIAVGEATNSNSASCRNAALLRTHVVRVPHVSFGLLYLIYSSCEGHIAPYPVRIVAPHFRYPSRTFMPGERNPAIGLIERPAGCLLTSVIEG